jgi:hypothetical protein
MTKIASMTGITRGTVIGKRDGVQPTDEAEHFFKFEMCGGWIDVRDLDHEEPLPHPASDPVQQRRRIISAAPSGVGAMRRGHFACEVRGHHAAPLGGRDVVKAHMKEAA